MNAIKTEFSISSCRHPTVIDVYHSRRIPVASGGTVPMGVYIPQEQGDFLFSLIQWLQPALTIEVGMANGLSTLFIAAALQQNGHGRHIAIDPFQASDWQNAALCLIQNAGLKAFVELRELSSHQALPQMEREGLRAQFAFVDGSHLFDYVLTDFLCIDRILDVGGLIAFDDSDWPAIRQVLRYVLANRHYEVAFPEVIIEPTRISPRLSSRILRKSGKIIPTLGGKMRPDFMQPDEDLRLKGRCVVLRKLAEDDRNSQTKFHHTF